MHTKILNKRRCIKAFIQDASYRKNIRTCNQCGWFGLEEDNPDTCPFCGNKALTNMLPMLRPWGFAPRNATSIETAQLNEEYSATQQPLYSTLPNADDVTAVNGCANIRMAVRPNQRIIMLNKGGVAVRDLQSAATAVLQCLEMTLLYLRIFCVRIDPDSLKRVANIPIQPM